jgi:periplasmic divalent cation tolerance protein
MQNIIWLLNNCVNKEEAHKIGELLLKNRIIACYDIIPEREAAYFWPPKSGQIEKIKGSLLIGVTFEEKFSEAEQLIKENHSDDVPFIGSITINQVNQDYRDWLTNELK